MAHLTRDRQKAMFARKFTVKKIDKPVRHFEGKMFVVQSHGGDVSFPLSRSNANKLRNKLIKHGDRMT